VEAVRPTSWHSLTQSTWLRTRHCGGCSSHKLTFTNTVNMAQNPPLWRLLVCEWQFVLQQARNDDYILQYILTIVDWYDKLYYQASEHPCVKTKRWHDSECHLLWSVESHWNCIQDTYQSRTWSLHAWCEKQERSYNMAFLFNIYSALDIIQSSYYIHGPLCDENVFAVLYVSLCYGPYTLL